MCGKGKESEKEVQGGGCGPRGHDPTLFGCADWCFRNNMKNPPCHMCCHFGSPEDTSWWLVSQLSGYDLPVLTLLVPSPLVSLYPHACWNQSAFSLVLICQCDWIHYLSITIIIIIHHSDWFQSRFVPVCICFSVYFFGFQHQTLAYLPVQARMPLGEEFLRSTKTKIRIRTRTSKRPGWDRGMGGWHASYQQQMLILGCWANIKCDFWGCSTYQPQTWFWRYLPAKTCDFKRFY